MKKKKASKSKLPNKRSKIHDIVKYNNSFWFVLSNDKKQMKLSKCYFGRIKEIITIDI